MNCTSFLENPSQHRVLNRYYGITENGKIIMGSKLKRLTASFSGLYPAFRVHIFHFGALFPKYFINSKELFACKSILFPLFRYNFRRLWAWKFSIFAYLFNKLV
jgi:hypothetical protein